VSTQAAWMGGQAMTEHTYAARVHRVIAALLLTFLRSLSSGGTLSTDSPGDRTRVAVVSTIGGVAPSRKPRRVISANLPSPQSNLRAENAERDANSEPDANTLEAPSLVYRPLDLRVPDLRSIQGQLAAWSRIKSTKEPIFSRRRPCMYRQGDLQGRPVR
jgi:hypothetical protein